MANGTGDPDIVEHNRVLVAIGPEWAPVRQLTTEWLIRAFPSPPRHVTVATNERRPDTPTGRVVAWVLEAWPPDGTFGTAVGPGDQPPTNDGVEAGWIGVTELLLDPDPVQTDQLYAFGLWTLLASRLERLRLTVAPDLPAEIAERAGRHHPLASLLVGEWEGQRLVIASRDLIAAEVTARAFRAIAQPAGDTGLSPWQAPVVQAAIEQGLGAPNGHAFEVELRVANPIAPHMAVVARRLLKQIVDAIDTQLGVF